MSNATSRTSNKRPAANAQASENANQRKKTEGMTFQRFVNNTNVLNLDIIASHVANTPQSDAQAEHAQLSPPMQTAQSPVVLRLWREVILLRELNCLKRPPNLTQ